MLRWLKTVVVSDVEKAHEMRQVGIGVGGHGKLPSDGHLTARWRS